MQEAQRPRIFTLGPALALALVLSFACGPRAQVCFWLAHRGITRADVELPAGRLYFNAGAWGDGTAGILAKRGTLTIRQRRLGWLPFLPSVREGSFLVGTFRAAPPSPIGGRGTESERDGTVG